MKKSTVKKPAAKKPARVPSSKLSAKKPASIKIADKEQSASVVLAAIEKEALPALQRLRLLRVSTSDEYNNAAQYLSLLKELSRVAEAKRKEIVDPINQAVKAVNKLFKPFTEKVELCERTVKNAMVDFLNSQERKAAALEEKFHTNGGNIATLLKKQEALQVTSEDAVVRMLPVLKIVDPEKIPREYLVPDERKILQALKDGTRVSGCEIEMVKNIAI